MRRTTTLLSILALALAAALPRAARAEDAPQDLPGLVRQAMTAETADRDIDRAIALYRRALALSATTDAGLDAFLTGSLRLADLLEARGDAEGALAVLETATKGCAARMDDATKQRVTAAMTRLAPPGRSFDTPLGRRTRVADGPDLSARISPLEEKILNLVREKTPEADAALRQVGKDALPALERAIRTERPDLAAWAANLMASIGGLDAVPGLLRVIRDGDPFARAAARDALLMGVGPEEHDEKARAAYLAALVSLLDVPALADQRERIQWRRSSFLKGDEMLALADAGGAEADFWLARAVASLHPAALDRVLERTRKGSPLPVSLVGALGSAAGFASFVTGQNGPDEVRVARNLEPALRLRILDVLAAQPTSAEATASIARVALVCVHGRPPADPARASEVAWTHVLRIEGAGDRAEAAHQLAASGVPLPSKVLAANRGPFVAMLSGKILQLGGWQSACILGGPLLDEPALWTSIAEGLSQAGDARVRAQMLYAVTGVLNRGANNSLPPAAQDALWVPLLPLLSSDQATGPDRFVWPYQAAARSGDPKVLEWARAYPRKGLQMYALAVVRERYTGPGLLEFAEDSLTDGTLYDQAIVVLQMKAKPRAFFDRFLARAPKLEPRVLAEALGRIEDCANSFGWTDRSFSDRWPDRPLTGPAWKEAGDERWIDLLAGAWPKSNPQSPRHTGITALAAMWAAASGSPRFLELVKARISASDPDAPLLENALVAALPYYAGTVPVAFAEALVTGEGYPRGLSSSVATLPLRRISSDASPEARTALRRLAASTTAWIATSAIRDLALAARDAEGLAALLAPGSGAEARPFDQRSALVQAADALRLKAAIPFLLAQYQDPLLEISAGKALDDIRAYHERFSSFSKWATDLESGRRDLGKLLDDPDPEIRRAAVLSLGALGDKEALPALVRIAKEEKDPRVRAAALEAVERIARSSPTKDEPK